MLDRIFFVALQKFLHKEQELIKIGVSERCLCSRLAMILERIIHKTGCHEYYADVEYNRVNNGSIKTMIDNKMEVIRITCDVILHSRGHNSRMDNLIAIEMKKSTGKETEKISDRNRLIALTSSNYDDIHSYDGTTQPEHVCGYLHGYFIDLNTETCCCHVQEFRNGNLYSEFNLCPKNEPRSE